MRVQCVAAVAALCAASCGARPLFPDDVKTVCIVSVSSIIPQDRLREGVAFLENAGLKVKTMPNVGGPGVAPPEVRARLFEEAWLSPDVDAILFSRGGEGAADVLPFIDWERLRVRDMRVVGFSDVTLILNAMVAEGAGRAYSGPMLSTLPTATREAREWFSAMMRGDTPPPLRLRVLSPGAAEGLPMGGHVTRMHALSKTGPMPSAAGRIVFFECTARHPAATVVADLEELRDGGFLDGAAAVVFANFTHAGEERAKIDEFLPRFAGTIPCPVFADFPYGHCPSSRLLDFSRRASISADGVFAFAPPEPPPLRMRNIAHRGMWDRETPQNTVEAIGRAYAAGATWVETDFHHVKSGQMLCIHHEGELKRYTGCAKKIRDLTPEDVATLDLGRGDSLERTFRIPLLDQVLELVPPHGVLQAEIKGYSPQYADIFDAAVRAAGLSERNIVVSSFNLAALADFGRRYPSYRKTWLVALPPGKAFDAAFYVAKCREAGVDVFCPGCGSTRGTMSPADADAVRTAGLEFRVYGVNSPKDLARAKELGAAGFTCNHWKEAFGWAADLGGVELLK